VVLLTKVFIDMIELVLLLYMVIGLYTCLFSLMCALPDADKRLRTTSYDFVPFFSLFLEITFRAGFTFFCFDTAFSIKICHLGL